MLTAEVDSNNAEQVFLNYKISHALYVILNAKTDQLQNQSNLVWLKIVV